jgi:hypothetical protein
MTIFTCIHGIFHKQNIQNIVVRNSRREKLTNNRKKKLDNKMRISLGKLRIRFHHNHNMTSPVLSNPNCLR